MDVIEYIREQVNYCREINADSAIFSFELEECKIEIKVKRKK